MTQAVRYRAVIIGAGPSGLAAVKALLDAGISPIVVYEKGDRVGGNWVYTAREGHSSVFDTTHIISSKALSQYSDFPMPADYPDYPSHRQLLSYFEGYAQRFELERVIEFGREVTRVESGPDGGWRVELADGTTVLSDAVLVASGHHWDPRWPTYPGEFTGRYLHSHQYKTAEPFRGERVLVIGGGNSACDIAVETSRLAAHTGLSLRRGYYIVPKFMFGQPPDVMNDRMQWIPSPIRRRLHYWTWRLMTGGNEPYGLPEPDHAMLTSHPVVNSELLYFIRHGRVQPYPDIARFDGGRVHFVDGRSESFDTVIAATGFRINFPFLDPTLADFAEGDVPLYLRVFHPQRPSLAFIGLVQPAGCIWPLAEAQAKLVAQHLTGEYRLPPDARERAGNDAREIRRRYVRSPRHSVEVDFHEHMRDLRRALKDG
ncbi:MAG: NAD(P)-binding domain-containing protein [Gemmatimonadota bacterium]